MALLKKVELVETKQRNIRLSYSSIATLAAYSRHLNRPEGDIIGELLEYATKRDPEFVAKYGELFKQGKAEPMNHRTKTLTTTGAEVPR